MRTKLANPTRYHVIQKQKSQVKQYLSESFKTTEWAGSLSSSINSNGSSSSISNLIPYPVIQHNHQPTTHVLKTSKSQPATTSSTPVTKSSTNYKLLNHINNRNGIVSNSTSDLINRSQSLEFSAKNGTAGSTCSLPYLFQNVTASPSDQSASNCMSPLSSVATSASEVSLIFCYFIAFLLYFNTRFTINDRLIYDV